MDLLWDIDISLKAAEFSEIVYSPNNQISNFCDFKGYFEKEIIEDLPTETLVSVYALDDGLAKTSILTNTGPADEDFSMLNPN